MLDRWIETKKVDAREKDGEEGGERRDREQ